MNFSDIPSRILKAFGVNGLRNTIANDSSSTTDNNGVATFDKGFPPITMQPLSAGGLPPDGKDVNGVLYAVSLQQRWANAGMGYSFNQEFSDAVTGYPRGSILLNSTGNGNWLSLTDNNQTPPEPLPGATWVPLNSYGYTTVSGFSSSTVMLNAVQASKDRIILTGDISSNINLVLPLWLKSWTIVNRCTGNFSIICKTQSGTGVSIPNGSTAKVYGDGADILTEFGTAAYKSVGTSSGQIPDMSSFNSGTGWQLLPGGRIFQWGGLALAGGSTQTFNFPRAFPNRALSITATFKIPATGTVNADIVSSTQFSLQNTYTGLQNCSYFAIGE